MKNNNILIRKTRIPVYRSRLWIVICPSLTKAIDKVEDQINTKIHSDKDKLSTRAYTYASIDENGAKTFILILRPASKPGEIAHETKHLLNIIFNWHGVKLSLTNDEPECYYLERMIDQVHNTIKQYKKLYSKPPKHRKDPEVLLSTP